MLEPAARAREAVERWGRGPGREMATATAVAALVSASLRVVGKRHWQQSVAIPLLAARQAGLTPPQETSVALAPGDLTVEQRGLRMCWEVLLQQIRAKPELRHLARDVCSNDPPGERPELWEPGSSCVWTPKAGAPAVRLRWTSPPAAPVPQVRQDAVRLRDSRTAHRRRAAMRRARERYPCGEDLCGEDLWLHALLFLRSIGTRCIRREPIRRLSVPR